jgi:hypothetical protein
LLVSFFHGNTLYESGCCTSDLRTRGKIIAVVAYLGGYLFEFENL